MPIPNELRQSIIEEIEQAFGEVTRGDGVSLHQADVIDRYGSDEEEAQARLLDTDVRWQDIPDEVLAAHTPLTFLDGKGALYYLPAYMRWSLRAFDRPENTIAIDYTIYYLAGGAQDWARSSYIFDERQCSVIRRFLEYMVLYTDGRVDDCVASEALNFWESYRVRSVHMRPVLISETVEKLPGDQLMIHQIYYHPKDSNGEGKR